MHIYIQHTFLYSGPLKMRLQRNAGNYVAGILNLIPATTDSWPCRSANSNYAHYIHIRGIIITATGFVTRTLVFHLRLPVAYFISFIIREMRSLGLLTNFSSSSISRLEIYY